MEHSAPLGLCRGQGGSHQGAAAGGVSPPQASLPSSLTCSYLDTIEQAVSEGQTLLIEDVGETVEPVLDHLLGRNTIKKGRSAHPVLWCQGVSPTLSNHCCPKNAIFCPVA